MFVEPHTRRFFRVRDDNRSLVYCVLDVHIDDGVINDRLRTVRPRLHAKSRQRILILVLADVVRHEWLISWRRIDERLEPRQIERRIPQRDIRQHNVCRTQERLFEAHALAAPRKERCLPTLLKPQTVDMLTLEHALRRKVGGQL